MKAIVFDMDGVLFDSETLYLNIWHELGEEKGLEGIDDLVLSCIGITLELEEEYFKAYYGADFPFDEIRREASRRFRQTVDQQGMPLKEGVFPLLDYLKAHHYRIALASSTKEAIVIRELTDTGLIGYFDAIIGGDHLARSKPAPDIYLQACAMIDADPAQTWAVEDSRNGVLSAYHADMKVIMVPDHIAPDAQMTSIVTVICPSLMEVIDFLEKQTD